ncbi:vacuolar protein sorting-associated protein 18 homolog isoform X2 [Ruditapes philippinarum]|uniref:vacuolar protein sorting-associated protein 18 homolog isoform X2 n=1 Tax=Ruditapes philippinarum TaxID=129788 RepID=UPI00295C090F|nr:vacuolar protein sorting-associated protein 18 homolog isoform X2 [Ruditapes philippinarum]
MASILDQYENAQASYTMPTSRSIPEPLGPGIIDARFNEEDTPIFTKKKINFKPEEPITHLAVCNNFLVMAMSHGVIMRLDLEHADEQERVEIFKKGEEKVHKIFLDPTGRHLIISLDSTENLYISRNSKKPKPIVKLKGYHIDSVGWNWQNANENTTGAILLGTSKGNIFETELSANDDSRFWQGNLDQYLKQLFNLKGAHGEPITGIEFDRMPSDSMTEYQYFILVTTPGKLYQFLGSVSKTSEPPMFQQLFQQFEDQNQVQYQELPGDFGYSELRLFFTKFRESAKKFAWMTGPGVYYGDIDTSGKLGPYSVTCKQMLMRYPKDSDERGVNTPFSMVLTEFHTLLLFSDRLKAFCLLNEQQIYDELFTDRFGKLIGLWKDPLKGTIWVFTSQNVFKYKVTREDRDVWQMYLDKGDFELAKEYCRDNIAHKDRVLTKQAEYLFSERRFLESAEMYAQTQNSFEEVALKFIRLEDKDALRKLLHKKLESLRPQDKTQMTMLVTWLIEIYLNQLGELKEQQLESSPTFKKLQEEFQTFLKQTRTKECVVHNKNVVYDLISSHGDVVDLVFFAHLMQDYEKVISHHIQYDNYRGALEVLSKQEDMKLYYKFSPLLIQYIPKDTVRAWISQGKKLDPKRLIPALVQYDHKKYSEQGSDVISYLEFCVYKLKNKDQAIHNYLLSLYAQLKPEKLLDYLQDQDKEAEEIDGLCYDLKYALRLCLEYGHKRECVHIYSLMNLYEEAVDLALTVDVELAKSEANKPDEDDYELRKKLWLRIARHVVEEEKDVKRAMDFLHECDLLKIEDILPFFPDFVTIDHFKDAIVSSLDDYNRHIETLKEEMDEATGSAEEIRKEIQAFRNKYAQVKALDKCSKCGFPLMTRAFYLFPCQHKFHSDCLIEEILPNLPGKRGNKVKDLQKKLAERDDTRQSVVGKQDPSAVASKLTAKAELDDLVASECIYCGFYMINSIDKPFLEEDDNSQGWL